MLYYILEEAELTQTELLWFIFRSTIGKPYYLELRNYN